MAAKKRGLGRGLGALLGDIDDAPASEKLQSLPIEYLQPGQFQPRKDMDSDRLKELADSIKAHGVVQPIVVRTVENGKYEIIAGERRWRAAQIAGLHEVPVVEKQASDQAVLAIALIENIQREDLNPLDQAGALLRLSTEFDMTHQQIADAVGKSRATVTNLLRLNDLQPAVKQRLASGQIEMGHARALLTLEPAQQVEASRIICAKKMTVRAAERLVQEMRSNKVKSRPDLDPDIKRLQIDISGKLGTRVQIKHAQDGKGQLVISYASLDQLEGVLQRIH